MSVTVEAALSKFKKKPITVSVYVNDNVETKEVTFEDIITDDTCITALIKSIINSVQQNAVCSFSIENIVAASITSNPAGIIASSKLEKGKILIP